MPFRLSMLHKGLLVVGIFLSVELFFFAAMFHLVAKSEQETWHESHVKSVLLETDALIISIFDATTALVAYSSSRSSYFQQKAEVAIEKIPLQLKVLQQLVEGFPKEQQSMNRIADLATRALAAFRRAERGLAEGRELMSFLSGREYQNEAESILTGLAEELEKFARQERLLQKEAAKSAAESRSRLQAFLLIAAALQGAIAVILAVAFSRGIIYKVNALVDNTNRLLKKQTLRPPVQGNDEIAHLDKVFHQMADSLDQAEKAKQEFVSVISHELRSPLSSIGNTLALLSVGAYGELTETGSSRVAVAEINTKRLLALINELLEVKKLEAGKMQLEQESFPINEVASRVAETLRVLAEEKSVAIELTCDSEEIPVFADPRRVEQVMVNLMSNAVKYSPPSSLVSMSVHSTADYIEVRVTDCGCGIAEEHLSTVFEKFEQVERKNNPSSTGLGLPIAKAIVEAHGGEIGVESMIGKGSTFWFRLPHEKVQVEKLEIHH
jgi:signal transduction histidine kinase